jgi:hypothetical protein
VLGASGKSPISFDEFFDFTSGYEDPRFIIPGCSIQPPPCDSLQASSSAFSGNPLNSERSPSHLGSQSINWDFALSYSTTNTSGSLQDTTSLLPTTSTSASSSAALTGGLPVPDLSFHSTPDWGAFSTSESQFLGDGTELLPGGPTLFTTAEDNTNILAISSGMGSFNDTNTSMRTMTGKTFPSCCL